MALNPDAILEMVMHEMPSNYRMGGDDGPYRQIIITKPNENPTGRKYPADDPRYVSKYTEFGRLPFAEFLMIVNTSVDNEHAVKRIIKRITTGVSEASDALPPQIQDIVNKAIQQALAGHQKAQEVAAEVKAAAEKTPEAAVVKSHKQDPARARRELELIEWARAHGLGEPRLDKRNRLAGWWVGMVRKKMAEQPAAVAQ